MRHRVVVLAAAVACMTGCSGTATPSASDSEAVAAAVVNASLQSEPAPTQMPVPAEEPSDAVVRKLIFEQYEEMERAGGMPVTMTATGQSFSLRAKLHDARKESCSRTPQAPPGSYECSLIIKLSLTGDGSDPALEEPSEQGARIGVKWDPSGKWVRQ